MAYRYRIRNGLVPNAFIQAHNWIHVRDGYANNYNVYKQNDAEHNCAQRHWKLLYDRKQWQGGRLNWDMSGARSVNMSTHSCIPWWRHQMDTFSRLLAICAGNSPVTCEFTAHRPVMRSFDVWCAWINGWVNTRDAGDLRRHRPHYDVTVMQWPLFFTHSF